MSQTVLGIVHLVFFFAALIQIIQADKPTGWKVGWAIVVFLLPLIGLILFFVIAKR